MPAILPHLLHWHWSISLLLIPTLSAPSLNSEAQIRPEKIQFLKASYSHVIIIKKKAEFSL